MNMDSKEAVIHLLRGDRIKKIEWPDKYLAVEKHSKIECFVNGRFEHRGEWTLDDVLNSLATWTLYTEPPKSLVLRDDVMVTLSESRPGWVDLIKDGVTMSTQAHFFTEPDS